jgi:ent-kaurene synthase
MDEQVTAPIDFNITFPGLLSLAIDMGLKFPIRQTDVHGILRRREMD